MANNFKVASVIAKRAVKILDNNLVMGNKVYRAYEDDFGSTVKGHKIGETLTIRKPADFEVTDGAVMNTQDIVEGSTSITVNQRKHVAFEVSSQDMTLNLSDFEKRVIEPAAVQLANQVDVSCMELYKDVPSWVGTPGQTVDSFADFYKAPERMNELAVPMEDRCAVLSPADEAGMIGTQTGLYMQDVAKDAYRKGMLGRIGGVDTYMSQNVLTHTVGVATGTPLVNGADQDVTYNSVKDSFSQTLNTDGWTNSTTGILKKGDVFTIAGVFAVNPVTKLTLPFLRQFTVLADANSGASTGPAALTISPPIIDSGAQQTVSAAPADNAAITVLGTGNTSYRQNLVFHKNAFALASVPLVAPAGAVDTARESYKGLSIRVQPVYDGTNDVSKWRMDILYGVKAIDPRLATRLSGTA